MTASLVICADLKAFPYKALDSEPMVMTEFIAVMAVVCSLSSFATDFILCVKKLKLAGT
jgi:hypothetical protein